MDNMDHNGSNSAPVLCSCGFFANPRFQNMCSKCFKDSQKKNEVESPTSQQQQQQQLNDILLSPSILSPSTLLSTSNSADIITSATSDIATSATSDIATATSPAIISTPAASIDPSTASVATAEAVQVTTAEATKEDGEKKPTQARKDRCFTCKAKLPLSKQISNKCKCDLIFCDSHKAAGAHECSFDYASSHQSYLEKKNVKLVGEKVMKL